MNQVYKIEKCGNISTFFLITYMLLHTLTNLDYLAMVKQLEPNDFEGCVKSFYPDYLGDRIYQFIRTDTWYGKDHQQIGDQEYTLWIEINVRQTKDDQIIALISLHDAESDNSSIRDF